MLIRKLDFCFLVFLVAGMGQAFAADACSLLTAGEVEAALKEKVTRTIPSSAGTETGCIFQLGKDQVVLSYFTDPSAGPKVKSVKEDPFIRGTTGPNVKDYGNFGCHWVDAQILFSTNCNRYQPRWLHIAVQVHDAKGPVPMDVVKGLLEKAANRFK
jgi:hypothetical protein